MAISQGGTKNMPCLAVYIYAPPTKLANKTELLYVNYLTNLYQNKCQNYDIIVSWFSKTPPFILFLGYPYPCLENTAIINLPPSNPGRTS